MPPYGITRAVRMTFTCERCGRDFDRLLSSARHQANRFCSRACFQSITVEERFWAKVRITGGCWLWRASTSRNGYGKFRLESGELIAAHRYAYESQVGDIPPGLFLLHTCDTPACVRPDHLVPGTNQANIDDMVAKRRNERGSQKALSKLTEDDVRAIRATDCAKWGTMARLAREYGVSPSLIYRVRNGTIWTHVEPHDQKEIVGGT